MPFKFLPIGLLLAMPGQSVTGTDYARLNSLGGNWGMAARADKLSTMEVSIVSQLVPAWEASNRENKYDPYVRKLSVFYHAAEGDRARLMPVLHGAACWHARQVAMTKGEASAPPRLLWNWISPRNSTRCAN